MFRVPCSVFSRKTAERQRLAAESPLPDLDGEVFAEFVQAVLETSQGRTAACDEWRVAEKRH